MCYFEGATCIEMRISSVWYDTIDQPVIPIKLTNICETEIVAKLEIRTPTGEQLYKSSPITLKPRESTSLEVTLTYYGEIEITGSWQLKGSNISASITPVKLKV